MPGTKRLQRHLAEMIALETKLSMELGQLAQDSKAYPEASQLLLDIQATSSSHRDDLQSRLSEIGGQAAKSHADTSGLNASVDDYPVTASLSAISSTLNKAIIGYAMLRSISLRNRDSSLIGERNTGDLAEQHTKNYVEAMHRIYRILHNAVLWELDAEGEHCQCTCPSCGLGICMCSQGPRRTLSDIWADAGPISNDNGVLVQKPRPGSAAEEAGLNAGDRILAADDSELESHFVLQGVISGHELGERIKLRVERISGEPEDVTITLS